MRLILLMLILVSRPIFGCDPDHVQSMDPASEEQLQALVTCLASPDPELRDRFAYMSLVKLLRDKPFWGQLEYYESDVIIEAIQATLKGDTP